MYFRESDIGHELQESQLSLANRSAIVTGGAGFLGWAIALNLRKQGCQVAVLDRDSSALARLDSSQAITRLVCDLTDSAAIDRCLSEAWEQLGPISILVNAAGLIHSAPLINIADRQDRRHRLEVWRRVLDDNLTSTFLTTVSTVDRMVSTRTRGVVISISSVAAGGNAGQGAYSAAKAGINALTRAWAKELGPLGIRFVAIAPGFIDTPTTHAALEGPLLKEWVRRTPLRRLGSVESVTSAVLFAAMNEHLTGTVVEVDGGLTL